MRSPRLNGEELRGNWLTKVHLKKMAVKTECVCALERLLMWLHIF